jgi:hypothetical protein
MLELAQGSVDESITVQVITFVSLLYLPASLVAVSEQIHVQVQKFSG